jgi:hypothetical protein
MTGPHIICPKCQSEIPLTDALARPIIEAERQRFAAEMRERASRAEARELELRALEATLAEQRRLVDSQTAEMEREISRRLEREREAIRHAALEAEQERSKLFIAAKDQELTRLKADLEDTQRAEIELRRQRNELEEERRSLELQINRRMDEERQAVREATQREEQQRYSLLLAEREKVISGMKHQLEDMRRKTEQGSQQLQGEVQEVALEQLLRHSFPKDSIEPVPAGCRGADVLHRVTGPNGLSCGTIVWESKRTKTWQDAWLAKNREDQRTVGAHLGVIVSTALPRTTSTFDRIDEVWVTGFDCVIPLAKALRHSLVQAALARDAEHGRDRKTDRMYDYVISPVFRQRLNSILEAYRSLTSELNKEKRAATTSWARREKVHELVLAGAAGLDGDIQGILGDSLADIETFEAPLPQSTEGPGTRFQREANFECALPLMQSPKAPEDLCPGQPQQERAASELMSRRDQLSASIEELRHSMETARGNFPIDSPMFRHLEQTTKAQEQNLLGEIRNIEIQLHPGLRS